MEDNLKLRKKFESIVNSAADMFCVGAHTSVGDAVLQMTKAKPDMIIMNIKFLDMSSIACLCLIQTYGATAQAVLKMSHSDDECVDQALMGGINGRHVGSSFPDQLVQTIRNADRGGMPMRAFIVLKLAQQFHNFEALPNEAKDLSPRQQQIIDLLAKGFIYREIGDKLNIGSETVRSHVKQIYKRWGVRNRVMAITKYRTACMFS